MFKDTLINVSHNPTLIVGQSPSKLAKDQFNWGTGPRSSELLRSILSSSSNLILTNVVKHQAITNKRVRDGLCALKKTVACHQPTKIICLGQFSYKHVNELGLNTPVYQLPHPSWIARFNRDKNEYANELRKLINE